MVFWGPKFNDHPVQFRVEAVISSFAWNRGVSLMGGRGNPGTFVQGCSFFFLHLSISLPLPSSLRLHQLGSVSGLKTICAKLRHVRVSDVLLATGERIVFAEGGSMASSSSMTRAARLMAVWHVEVLRVVANSDCVWAWAKPRLILFRK